MHIVKCTNFTRVILFAIIALLLMCSFNVSHVNALSKSQINTLVIKTLYGNKGGHMSCDFDGYKNTKGRHEGVDYKLKEGVNIYSIVDGTVTRVTNTTSNSKLSTLAIYDSKNKKTVIYLHAKNIIVKKGQSVKRGQKVAQEGNRAGGTAHTHIEVRNGKHTSAAKSVNDYTLQNQSPYGYFEKILSSNSTSSGTASTNKSYFTGNKLKPITTYIVSASQSCKTYSNKNLTKSTGAIYVNDQCKILEFYSNNSCKVQYPVSNGKYRTAYISLYKFFDYNTLYKVKLKSNSSVYSKSNMKSKIGTSYTSDTVYQVGSAKNGKVKIIYNLSKGGGWKSGWIYSSKIK